MDVRRSQRVKKGKKTPSGTVTTQSPLLVSEDRHEGPEVPSEPLRMEAEDTHTIDDEAKEDENYVVKIETAEEYEEQVDDDFDEEMKVDIKEEDLHFEEDSYLTRYQIPHTKKENDPDAVHTQEQGEPHPDSAEHLRQDPTPQHSHRWHELDDASSSLQEKESQQLYPEVLATLNIKSDRDVHTDPLEEINGTHLLENTTDQSTCGNTSSLVSPAPTFSLAGSHHTQVSVRPEQLRSESSPSGLSSTQAKSHEEVHQCEQVVGLTPKTVPQNTAMPSYSHYVARAIEIILNECPKDKQMLCGQQILTAALRIQMKMKTRSSHNSPTI